MLGPYLGTLPVSMTVEGPLLHYLDAQADVTPTPQTPPDDVIDYEAMRRLAVKAALSRGVPQDRVDDTVQTSFVNLARVIQSRGDIPFDSSGNRNPKSYLVAIIRNQISNDRRNDARRALLTVEPGDHPPLEDIPSTGQSVENEALMDINPILLEVIEGLTERQRTVIVMEAEGYSRKDIAAYLGAPSRGAVSKLIYTARRTVMARLREQAGKGHALGPDITTLFD